MYSIIENLVGQAKRAIEAIGLQYAHLPKLNLFVKEEDGWYVASRVGPFKTLEVARMAIKSLKNNHHETE
jgi:hypothetical protein